MIRAIVFDFDGVLANSEPLHFQAFRDVLVPHHLPLTERAYYDRYLGYDDVGAFQAIAADAGVSLSASAIAELVARKSERMEVLERDSSVLFPGAREAIERMAAYGATAIASGALRAEILHVLTRERLLQYFPVLVAAGDTARSKPDPAPYKRAVELLSGSAVGPISSDECVAVEDSRWGLQSARDAGLHTIAITNSYDLAELGPADAIIDHLDKLTPQLLQSFDR